MFLLWTSCIILYPLWSPPINHLIIEPWAVQQTVPKIAFADNGFAYDAPIIRAHT